MASSITALNPVSRDVVILSFQLEEFLESNHAFGSLITEDLRQWIRQIVRSNFRPPSISRGISSTTAREDRSRARSHSVEAPSWPSNWAVDKSSLRASLKIFDKGTEALRKLQEPPSTGSTPGTSPLSTPSWSTISEPAGSNPSDAANHSGPSNSSSNPNTDHTSRATSAEEAIYKDPIGPEMAEDQSWQNTGFSQQQWTALQGLLRNIPSQPGPPGPPGTPGPAGQDAAAGTASGQPRWNPGDLGFFDPNYDSKSISTGSSIEHAGKETYFRDVHLFIERAKDLAVVKNPTVIRENLWMSLRGTALEWWTAELSATEKRITKLGENLDEWAALLVGRFKEPADVAIDAVLRERYTMRDATSRREPREFAQKILRSAKDAGMILVKNQLDIIYNGIDLELRRDLKKPEEATTVNTFLSNLDDCKYAWWAYAGRHGRNTGSGSTTSGSSFQGNRQLQSRPAGQYGQYNNSFNRGGQPSFGQSSLRPGYQAEYRPPYRPELQPRYQNPQAYQPQQSSQYQNRPPQPDQRSSGSMGAPPQRLQISGPPNRSGFPQPQGQQSQPQARPPFRPSFNNLNRPANPYPYRPFQNNQGSRFQPQQQQRAYQASEEILEEGGNFDDEYEKSQGSYQYHASEDQLENSQENFQDYDESYDNSRNDYENMHEVHFVGKEVEHSCSRCGNSFPSRNKLFRHLRENCKANPKTSTGNQVDAGADSIPEKRENFSAPTANNAEAAAIIQSTAKSSQDGIARPGYNFRGWKYATLRVRYSPDSEAEESDISPDSGCGVTLGDREYLLKNVPGLEIKKMASPIPVRGVGNKIISTNEYAMVTVYVNGIMNDTARTACFTMEVHLVDDLKANILIGTDTMVPQGMLVDLDSRKVKLGKCQGMEVPIEVTAKPRHATRTIRTKVSTVVAPGATVEVPVSYNGRIPEDRDFLFEPDCSQNFGPSGGVFAHVVDSTISMVQVYNATAAPVKLPHKAKLGSLFEYEQDGAFLATPEDAPLAVGNVRSWKANLAKGLMVAAAAFSGIVKDISSTTSGAELNTVPVTGMSVPQIDPSLEHVMPTGITVYGTPEVASQIASVADEFPEIWKDQGATIDIPEEEWMPIPLKPNVTSKPSRVYPVSQKDRDVIDETFDKLHDQGKMQWTSQPTPYSYPVFVVWRQMPDGSRKGRVVVDIRGLNKITESDSYPLPLQSDITSAVAGFPYISTVDGNGYFHQFLVRYKDRHKLTVVSHRGQEQYNVALMGYKGSPPYVQRQTDKILRPVREFVKAYVDDMIAFSKTLSQHLEHLRSMFALFREKRISLNPKKSFLGYPSVVLLGQRVDSLGLSTSEEKLAAITSLRFPKTLRELETFLGLTGWLRSSIPKYAQRANALQQRKTELTKTIPKESKGHTRKRQSGSSFYEPTEAEIRAFKDLQGAFASPTFLIHFDPSRKLYIDLDASKEWGFAAMIYHVVDDPEESFPRTAVQPILFLSKMLNQAEQNYWPTELEVAGIVWVIKKVRHMIESTKKPPVVVYTDHSAAVPISRQTSLSTSSTDKLNLRLVRASQYLSMFDLTVRHKAGKTNVVPDALSRLQGNPAVIAKDGPGILEALYGQSVEVATPNGKLFPQVRNSVPPGRNSVPLSRNTIPEVAVSYHVTLVEMSDSFKARLSEEYTKDPQWNKILEVVRKAAKEANAEEIASEESRTAPTLPPVQGPATEAGVSPQEVTEAAVRDDDLADHKLGLRFKLRDGLIYYTNFDDGRERLCIPNALEKDIFELAHDRQHHGGFHRSYDRVASSVYMKHLSKHLRAYIDHCPECELNQTKHHKPYGSMVPIDRPGIPFHTVAMDFIVALPVTADGCDCLLTVTDKFSKRVLMIPGKTTYDAAEWADLFLAALTQHAWGIPQATISDRDSKFMSAFWQAIFKKLGVEILASTAYHPQTDGQSERTNQTVEIALRYFITANPGVDWTLVLPYLQGSLNNSKNQSTGVSPNEVLYGFNVRDTLGLLTELPQEDFSRLRQLKREQAEDSIAFANIMAKAYYDESHKPISLPTGSKAYLRLHHGYKIPGLTNHKLHNQRVGPFKVLEKVGKLAYRLELPSLMKIHPVISIAQLEPGSGEDPYMRDRVTATPEVEEDGTVTDIFEIQTLLKKRVFRDKVQYLVKWKNSGNQHNAWYDIDDLKNARELIDEFEARPTPSRRDQTQKSIQEAPRGRGRPRKTT